MKASSFVVGAAAAALSLPQPALAADLMGSDIGHRTSAFAGATLRIGLDRHRVEERQPRLALGISRVHEQLGQSLGVRRIVTPGLELTMRQNAPPQLTVGGQSFREQRQRLGLAAGPAAMAVAGLAVAGVAVVALAGGEESEDELHRRQCLLPERELCR